MRKQAGFGQCCNKNKNILYLQYYRPNGAKILSISCYLLMSLCLSLPRPSTATDPMTIDRCGISSPPLWAFKNFKAIIKILENAVYGTITSISQSISVICSRLQSPDARFCSYNAPNSVPPIARTPPCGFTGKGRGDGRPPLPFAVPLPPVTL